MDTHDLINSSHFSVRMQFSACFEKQLVTVNDVFLTDMPVMLSTILYLKWESKLCLLDVA